MQTTLTTKLKLMPTPEQFAALRQTQLAYRDALNLVSQYAFLHGKTSSRRRLQTATYSQLRAELGLPAQLACNVPRQVSATYKGLWTKWRNNREARAKGYTKKRFKGLDRAPKYVSPTLTYNYGRDYSLKCQQQVSLRTLSGRIAVPYRGYNRHVALLQDGATLGAARLWYDQCRKHYYLLVSLIMQTPDPTPAELRQTLGVDVGQRYLASVASTQNQSQFYCGKEIRARADHYARVQKRLQRKGTRSATRRRIAISGRERRLKLNTNHCISARILHTHPQALIGVEDLTGIRDRTKRKRGKKASTKQRRANRHAAKWAFAELQSILAYKAALAGSVCIKVDPDYTSQTCPNCGYTSKGNRPKQGLLFVCRQCSYRLHADLVGARNIALRALAIRQDWIATGQLSFAPDVTDTEAKAARLSRYAELRWSLVARSSPSRG
ncbi:MAG: RNA-guided endonuclease InsQ/TnpB family protein [Ktedonobacterales bacterium]